VQKDHGDFFFHSSLAILDGRQHNSVAGGENERGRCGSSYSGKREEEIKRTEGGLSLG